MDRPWALPAATAFLTLEGVAVSAALAQRSGVPFGVHLLFAAKLPLCWLLARRNRAAFLLLTVWECMTVVVVFVNPVLHPIARLGLLGSAGFALALLGWSLGAFPAPATSPDPAPNDPSPNGGATT